MTTPDLPLGYRLRRAQQTMRTAFDEALAPLALSAPQYAALSVLAAHGALTNADLARHALVAPQSMTDLVRGLERRGALVSARESGRRAVQLSLSDEGRRLLDAARPLVEAVEVQTLARVNKSDQPALLRALAVIGG